MNNGHHAGKAGIALGCWRWRNYMRNTGIIVSKGSGRVPKLLEAGARGVAEWDEK